MPTPVNRTPRSSIRSSLLSLLALFLIALVPRGLLAANYLHAPIALDDMFQYDMLARSLSAGNGYRWYQREDVAKLRPYLDRYYGIELPTEQVPEEGFLTTFRAPGYPIFLALIYRLSGLPGRLIVVRILQALLSALLAPLSALLAWRLGFSQKAGLAAGMLVAFYPILMLYPLGLASENLHIPLVLLSVLALLRAGERGSWYALAAGIILGAATLTRGALGLFLPWAAIWLWRRRNLRAAVLLTLATSAILLPWMLRNSLILGRPAFVENSVGYNLFVGYHPEGDGGFVSEVAVKPLVYLDDGERDLWARQQAGEFIRDDPGRAIKLFFQRSAFFWGLEDRELIYFYSNNYFGEIQQPWLLLVYLGLIMPLVFVGIGAPFGLAESPGPARGLVLGLVFCCLLSYAPILAEPRFHLPLIPVLAVYAARPWTQRGLAADAWAGLRRGERRWIVAALAALLLMGAWSWDFAQDWPRLQQIMSAGGNRLRFDY